MWFKCVNVNAVMIVVYLLMFPERPDGNPAAAEHFGGESAPADSPAGLQGTQQGTERHCPRPRLSMAVHHSVLQRNSAT